MAKSPQPGIVEETVIRRSTKSAEEAEASQRAPDFLEYIEALRPEDWDKHIVYLYRVEPQLVTGTNEPAYLDKWVGGIEMPPNGQRVPISLEAIKEKYGGRLFRAILKRGSAGERITEARIVIDAPPKQFFDKGTSAIPMAATDASAAAAIGSKAIDVLSGQDSKAIELAMNVLTKAGEVISKPPAQPAADPLREKLVDAAIARMLNPPAPPDILAMITQVKTLFAPPDPPAPPDMLAMITQVKTLFAPPATNTVKEVVDTIAALKTAGLIPAGGDRTNMGIELARQIPNVTSASKDAIHEWRLGVEAQERTAAVMRGVPPPPAASPNYNPPAGPRAVSAPPPSEPAPAQDASAAAEGSLDPPIEWVEHKLVSILKKNLPVSETVDNVLDFLEDAAPGMIPELLTAGERMIVAGMIPASATPAEAGIFICSRRGQSCSRFRSIRAWLNSSKASSKMRKTNRLRRSPHERLANHWKSPNAA